MPRPKSSTGQSLTTTVLDRLSMAVMPSMKCERVALADLHADPANARTHNAKNLSAISDSLKQFGQVEPLIVQRSSGKVVGGNGRLAAMRSMGWEHVDVAYVNISDNKATALGIALNRTAELADWDTAVLKQLTDALGDDPEIDMGSLGLTDADLDELLKAAQGSADPTEQERLSDGVATTEQLMQLQGPVSQQRNDSEALEDVTSKRTSHACIHTDCLQTLKRVGNASVHLFFCDLPYGVTQNPWDTLVDIDALWREMLRVGSANSTFVFTATQPFTSKVVMSKQELFKYGLVWDKVNNTSNFFSAKRMPMRVHEDVLVFHRPKYVYNPQMTQGKPYKMKRSGGTSTNWNIEPVSGSYLDGKRYPQSIVRLKPTERGLHPTQKPVELLEWIVRTYSNPGDVVIDPTMGSGTTGAACATTGRRFIGCETDPAYFHAAQGRIAAAYRDGVDPLTAQAADTEVGEMD